MFFASDNAGPVHPKVMEALNRANDGWAMPYGHDAATARATELVREAFEAPEATVHFVATGTAANSLILATMCKPFETIFCAPYAHIHVDECNAPEAFTDGAKLTPVGDQEDKFSVEALTQAIAKWDPANIQNPGRGPVSITQVTERGTLYGLDEIAAITATAKAHDLKVHMDGARFTNAMVALDCSAAEMTWKAGVHAVSFGGTKNGLMGVEAAVIFDPDVSWEFQRRRKRAAHLFSKSRYLAAQMEAYLSDDLWIEMARAANAASARLVEGLRTAKDATFAFNPQANMIYVWQPRRVHQRMKDAGAVYYIESGQLFGDDPEELLLGRLVCDWSTPADQVDRFVELVAG
jgi:threonine aldolase